MGRPKKGSPEAKARDLERRMERARAALGKGATDERCRAWVEEERKRDAERLAAGKEAAHQRRLDAARRALGAGAPVSALETWVAEQKRREAREKKTKATSKATTKVSEAAKATREAQRAIKALASEEEAPVFPPDDADLASRLSLRDDPEFGQAFDGSSEVRTVRVTRLMSTDPDHDVAGVKVGEFFEMPYDRGQTQANTAHQRGGGRYRADALNMQRRVVSTFTFDVPGRAKPARQEEPAAAPTNGTPFVFVGPNGQRIHPSAWEPPDPTEERLDRLERLIERMADRPAAPAVDYEERRRYEEAREEARRRREEDQRREDQRREDERRREREEREDAARREREIREEKAHQRELEFRREEAQRAAALQETLFRVIGERPKDEGGAAAMQALAAVTGSFTGLASGMLETVSAAANREDSRSIVERILEGLAENLGPMLAGAKDIASTLAQNRAKAPAPLPPPAIAAPPSTPEPEPEPAPAPAFPDPVVLPDGRAIAAVHVQRIILDIDAEAKRRGTKQARPTTEELYALLGEVLDARPELDVSEPDIEVPAATPPPEPEPPAAAAPSPPAVWASHRCLYLVKSAFENGTSPGETLAEVIGSRDLSEAACSDLGAIFLRHESLSAAFLEIAMRFQAKGIRPLPGFIETFKDHPNGKEWLSAFLGAAAERGGHRRGAAA